MQLKNLYLRALDALTAESTRYRALAALRVYLAFHVIKKLLLSWPYLNLLYGPDSFAVWSPRLFKGLDAVHLRQGYILICGTLIISALLMLFGIGRRFAVLAVYVLVEVLQRLDGFVLNGGDNLIKFILLYMVFCDSFRYLALKPRPVTSVPGKWAWLDCALTNTGAMCMLVHLCVVYAVSGLHKAHAEVWFNGTAVHYTLLIDRFKGTSFNELIANNVPLVVLSTYFTVAWEIAFPILIWHRWARYAAIAGGLLIHSGIYVFMMIHDFEVLFLALYVLAFTDSELKAAIDFVRRRLPVRTSTPVTVPTPTSA